MTAPILALLLAGTHVCHVADIWTPAGQDLVAEVVCFPPAATWPVGRPIIRLVTLAEAKTWPPGGPCTAYVRNGDVTSLALGWLRKSGDLSVCAPGGRS